MLINLILSIILVLVTIYIIPIIVYGIFSAVAGLKPPDGSPFMFLLSVLISKTGTAIAFVLIFYFAYDALSDDWLLYGFIWWLMYAIGEIGQAIGPNYSWKEAISGITSETVYFPLSAYIVRWLIK